jgi:hypothetical protein
MQLILSFAGQKAMKSLEPVLAVRAITRRSATNFRHMWISLAAHMLLLTLPRTGWAPVVSSDSPLSHAGQRHRPAAYAQSRPVDVADRSRRCAGAPPRLDRTGSRLHRDAGGLADGRAAVAGRAYGRAPDGQLMRRDQWNTPSARLVTPHKTRPRKCPVTLKPDERRASTQHAQSQTTPFHDSSHATARSASGRRLSSTLRSRSRIRPHRRVLPPVGLQRSCDPVEGGGHPDLRGYRSEKVPLTRCVTHKANSAPQTSMWRWWVPAGTRR